MIWGENPLFSETSISNHILCPLGCPETSKIQTYRFSCFWAWTFFFRPFRGAFLWWKFGRNFFLKNKTTTSDHPRKTDPFLETQLQCLSLKDNTKCYSKFCKVYVEEYAVITMIVWKQQPNQLELLTFQMQIAMLEIASFAKIIKFIPSKKNTSWTTKRSCEKLYESISVATKRSKHGHKIGSLPLVPGFASNGPMMLIKGGLSAIQSCDL